MFSTPERVFGAIGTVFITAVALAGFMVAIYAAWLFHDLPDGSELADFRPTTSARVFAQDGTLLGEYGQVRRIYVPYDRIPKTVVNAFLAAEDRDFFKHSGVDVSGLSRAMVKNVWNTIRGRRLEGGSTITQQVAKNVLLKDNQRTLGRKLKEMILARRLEASLTKEQILEMYLNDINLGFRSYGVGVAAFNYYGKSLEDLSLEEIAYLAALPKGPNNYHPVNRKKEAIIRRNWVMREMMQARMITREEFDVALVKDLIVQPKPLRARYHDADYFVNEVEQRSKLLFSERIYSEGFYIKTTLNPHLQSLALDSLMSGLERYDRRHGWRGAPKTISPGENWIKLAQKITIPSERRQWIHALVTSASRSDVRITLNDSRTGYLSSEDIGWAFAGKGLKVGDIILVEPNESGRYRLRQIPRVNGAIVAIDPYSGRVLALVGGYSFSLSKFNRATQAKRQPGSSVKPFVYAVALEKDFTPASIVDDLPVTFKGGDGKDWTPKNYEGDFMGPQPIRRGIELSRNLMTVRLADAVGIRSVTQRMQEYGVAPFVPNELSAVLGAGEVTPYELTNAYALFVNGGRKVKPHLIDEIKDRNGNVIHRADNRICPAACTSAYDGLESPRITPLGEQVMDPITAYQINSFMQGTVLRGTAVAARNLPVTVGGKTGTTNNYRSAWFVGFSPDLVVGVFIGFDDNSTLGDKETGSAAALPVFIDFMGKAYKDRPRTEYKKPADAVFLTVHGHLEAFKPGTEPKYNSADSAQRSQAGPRPYTETWKEVPKEPSVNEVPPPDKKTLQDAAELY